MKPITPHPLLAQGRRTLRARVDLLSTSRRATIDAQENVRLTSLGYKFSSLIARLFFSEQMKSLERDI